MSAGTIPTRRPAAPAVGPAATAAAVAVALALFGAYAPNLVDLGRKWSSDPNYSHGFLVIPIALAILWQRRGDLDPARLAPHWAGWVAFLGIMASRYWLFASNEQWFEAATIPLAGAGLALAFGGWHLLRWAAPALAFLWLMLPLPPRINMVLAGPLQQLATLGSTTLLQAFGLPILSEGNVLLAGAERLNVEQACNGLSMLLSFVTLITATTIMVRSRPVWERVVLLVSTVPIALVSNVLRIALTAWAYYAIGPRTVIFPRWSPVFPGGTIERVVHDTAGWAMMPIALILVFVELKLLRWLVIEEEVQTKPALFIPAAYAPPPGVAKKPGKPGAGPGRPGRSPLDD